MNVTCECALLKTEPEYKKKTSMCMHNDQEHGKSIMTTHEIKYWDKLARMLII